MEKNIYKPLVFNAELGKLRGRHIYAINEPGHFINYYEVKLGEDNASWKCTACNTNPALVIRHEIDHMSQHFFEGFCEDHMPPKVYDILQSSQSHE